MFSILFCFLLGACRQEEALKIYNSPPTATITSHSDGTEFVEGSEVFFSGTVADSNHSLAELIVSWSDVDNVLCEDASVLVDGTSSCAVVLNSEQKQIQFKVRDPQGETGLDEIAIVVRETETPTIELLSPELEGTYYSDQLIFFSAVINDEEDDPQDLLFQWSSSLEGELPLTQAPDETGRIEAYGFLQAGQHTITMDVTDSHGKSATASVPITVGGPNSDPTCGIDSPASESAFAIGENVVFSGEADDVDINNSLLSVEWFSDLDGIINQNPPSTTGELGFTINTLSLGNHTMTLKVEDDVEGLCTATTQFSIGSPPILHLNSPLDGAVFNVGESIQFASTVEDENDVLSNITVRWTSDVDGVFDEQQADMMGNVSFFRSSLSPGSHAIDVVATDNIGLTDSTSFLLYINSPPTTPTVSLIPDPVSTLSDITAVYGGSSDIDGDTVSYRFEWFKNGMSTPQNAATISSSLTSVGETWTVRVTPNDGIVDGAYAEAFISISNTLPTVDSISIIPQPAFNDDILNCSSTTSDADETLTPMYSWIVNAIEYSGSSLDLNSLSVLPDDVVLCTATVVDNQGATASLSTSITIENREPTISGTTITPGTNVYNDSSLLCSSTVFDADEILQATYEWSINNAIVSTGDTFHVHPADASPGDTVSCTATATDSSGITVTDSDSVLIENRLPTPPIVTLNPNPVYTNHDVTVSYSGSTDADGDMVNYQVEWYKNGVLTTITGDTLSYQETAVTDLWTVRVTPNDGNNNGVYTEESIQISNSEPTVNSVVIAPSTVTIDDVLTCTATATDADQSLVIEYTWNVGASEYTGSTLDLSVLSILPETEVFCTAGVTDDQGAVASLSTSVIPENRFPTITGTTLSPIANVYNDTVVTCTTTVSDPDEIIQPSYEWTLNSNQIVSGDSIDLSTTNAKPEDSLRCTASAIDSLGATVSESIEVIISNRLPSPPTVSLSPTPARTTDDITVSYGVSTDADGDTITYQVQWYKNSLLTILTAGNVSSMETTVGEVWTVRVTPNDGISNGAYSEESIEISNSDPSVDSIAVSPSTATIDDVLTCTATASDADQALAIEYTWNIGALEYSGSSLDLSTTSATPETVVTCTAAVTDSYGVEASLSSSITINNRAPTISGTTITPGTGVYNDSSLLCSSTVSDPDEVLSPVYQWTIDGVLIASSAALDLATTAAIPGDSVVCTASATDSSGVFVSESTAVSVDNRTPSAPTVSISPNPANEGDDLLCVITSNSVDPDADSVSYSYSWTVNSNSTSYSTDTVSGTDVDAQELWTCIVTPNDGTNDGSTGSASITIESSLTDVLIIWDVNNSHTQALKSALESEGLTVDLSATSETSYNGSNPSPTDYDVVIHVNGTTYTTDMPMSGQLALVDHVYNGGGFIHSEWNAYEISEGRMNYMRNLTLFDRVSGTNGTYTWTAVSSQISHPVLTGVPSSFSVGSGFNEGYVHPFLSEEAVVLMRYDDGDMVAVREWGSGRIVGFGHAGNWNNFATLSNANIQQLYINAVYWCQ